MDKHTVGGMKHTAFMAGPQSETEVNVYRLIRLSAGSRVPIFDEINRLQGSVGLSRRVSEVAFGNPYNRHR